MEIGILVLLALVLFLILAPIIALVKSNSASREVESLQYQLRQVETEVAKLRQQLEKQPGAETPSASQVPAEQKVTPTPPVGDLVTEPTVRTESRPSQPETPPPIPIFAPPVIEPRPTTAEPPPVVPPPFTPKPAINWEQFMGVKLFAWIGGLALFIGVALFLKYSFEHNLVPPALRAAIGFVAGLGLVIGGVLLSNKRYTVTSQTLCATGVVILYAVTFACHAVYQFPLFGQIPTFVLMALITAGAFWLAVRMNALVVAVLGMLGGFLTPVLLSTGKDNPFGLFAYIALLDVGLIAVSLRRPWRFLALAAALGTVIMQIAWGIKFFAPAKVLVAFGIYATFNLLFLAGLYLARKFDRVTDWLAGAVALVSLATFVFTVALLSYAELGNRPGTTFAFVLLADLIVLALVVMRPKWFAAQMGAGAFAFGLVTLWMMRWLDPSLLYWALGLSVMFAVLHAAFPIALQRIRPGSGSPAWWANLFPPVALLLVLVPILKLPDPSFMVWGCVLLLNLLAIGLAIFTASLSSVLAVLLLTLLVVALWLMDMPADLAQLPESLVLTAGFAVFFFIGALFAVRKVLEKWEEAPEQATESFFPFATGDKGAQTVALLPAFAAVTPFLLLIMVILKLPITSPTSIFSVALLLCVMILSLARALRQDLLPFVGLISVLGLEHIWHFERFRPEQGGGVIAWYVGFAALYAVFPFLFHKRLSEQRMTWAAAALSAPLHFFLVHRAVSLVAPNDYMGLLPAAFAVPMLLGFYFIWRNIPAENPVRLSQLAWFGGVSLFFITLIFPLQFEREWITLGWALEGAALLWLFHRVPHPGLRYVGIGLLLVAFVRLALNPAVLEYHPRTDVRIFNWYLYAYLVAAGCMFAGAKLLAPPRDRVFELPMPPLLYSLGTILLFLLLNIEIADFFSEGTALTFEFRGNFARDMTYTIAWALFAFALLVLGIAKRVPGVRYAAIGLLAITLLKLFFHDLAHLKQLYRIGALISVAIIAMLASFIYQKFLATNQDSKH